MIEVSGIDSKMIANNIVPSEPVHPGEILKDELESRGISQRAFAREIGLSPSLFNELVNGKRAFTTEYALLIEAALGIESDLWINMQTEYNKHVAVSNPTFLDRLKRIRNVAAFI